MRSLVVAALRYIASGQASPAIGIVVGILLLVPLFGTMEIKNSANIMIRNVL